MLEPSSRVGAQAAFTRWGSAAFMRRGAAAFMRWSASRVHALVFSRVHAACPQGYQRGCASDRRVVFVIVR
jgi:hypothetical protein